MRNNYYYIKITYVVIAIVVLCVAIWFIPDVRNRVFSDDLVTPTPSGSPIVTTSATPGTSVTKMPTPSVTTSGGGRMIGEAVAVQNRAVAQYNVGLDQVLIIDATAVIWNDSCLGLPKPYETCTTGTFHGWSVTVQIKSSGATHTYRTNTNATDIRQEN